MTEQDPKDTEREEPAADAAEPVEPAPVDDHEPGAAEKAQGEEAAEEAKPKPKAKRAPRRKKAEEPAAEATEEPESAEAEAPAEEEKPKPKRAPRRKKAEEAVAEEEAPVPAPAPRRRAQPADGRPVVVRAQAKYVRSSPRKARLVCDQIRGKSVEDARAILATTPRAVARDWIKVLESAIANAENNHELVGEDLRIKAIHADDGPTLKRFRPRAMGRATKIRKRTSHLTILLSPKE
jgi:ribosomal protein L22